MKKLYRFFHYFGRMGSLTGVFTADESEVTAAIGKRIYLGEVLGKHSDVSLTLEEKNFTALTDDESFISKFDEYRCESGTNPLDYVDEDDNSNDDDEDED